MSGVSCPSKLYFVVEYLVFDLSTCPFLFFFMVNYAKVQGMLLVFLVGKLVGFSVAAYIFGSP